MIFRSALNSLWEGVISPFILLAFTTTPPPLPPSASSNIPMTPEEDRDMGFDAVNGEFSSVADCPCVSNFSAAVPMPGAYYPEFSVLPAPPTGCSGPGYCASCISAYPALFSGCEEEVGFDGSGHPTSGGFPTSASMPPPHCGRDGIAEPAITSSRFHASSSSRRARLASFAPSDQASNSGFEPSSSTQPAGGAIPSGHSTPPCSGYSRFEDFEPSPRSDYSSSPPSSHPSSPSPSGFFTSPDACAYSPNSEDDNNLQYFSKEESKSGTLGVNMPGLPSGNPTLPEPIQPRSLEQHISKLRRRLLFLKAKELGQGSSDKLTWYIMMTECLLDSELHSGKVTAESDPVSYASKRAFELETDVEVSAAKGAAQIELSHMPARKKARTAAKNSDLKTTADATAGTRRNSKIPPRKRSRTYSARRTARTELPAFPLFTPPLVPITPIASIKPESSDPCCPRSLPRTPLFRKRAQEGDAAMGPAHKKLKMSLVIQYKRMPKRKRHGVVTSSKRPRSAKAPLTPPMKSGGPSASVEELVGEYGVDLIGGERLAKVAPAAAPVRATFPRKRTSENIIVKSPITKRVRKEYFSEGMVLEYESDDDTETVDKKPGKAEATPFTKSITTPTNTAAFKSPLTSTLGKRTSTATQDFKARDARNKRGRKEYFQEGMILEYESDEEPVIGPNGRVDCSSGEVDYDDSGYYSPPSPFRAQSMFAARVEDVEEEDEIL
ncbi:hypothetical protein HOY82DRAFT_670985 [Tuber indicum]|nr:hypothetical protein HOY82DRAFT_670985 [Tuber indicum]